MIKYRYKTLAVCLDKETYEELNDYCKNRTYKSVFVRRLINKALSKIKSENPRKENQKEENQKRIKIRVYNYEELKEFAQRKGFGNVESFCTFAMAQYMSRYPSKNGDASNSCVD